MRKIQIFDSTLRDGAQGEGINFSVEDKLNIARALDKLGVDYIEAGNPSSNPKDLDFFKRAKSLSLKHAKLTAFGSTRRKGISPDEDAGCASLLSAETDAVAIFGKTWDLHVLKIINTTLEENLDMICDTVRFFKSHGKEVIFDAEHFFDGYKSNPEYALAAILAAVRGGADCVALCETNGGCLPDEIFDIVSEVVSKVDVPIGIHCHNDSGCAVANSIMAVKAGAAQVQGTYIGYGERTGNANLSSIIPALSLKMGLETIPKDNMQYLTDTARAIAEISNLKLENSMPYVGKSAFSHKAGMHIDGVSKLSYSFEHIDPDTVGNERRFLMSEVAGRSTVLKKISGIAPHITKNSPEIQSIVDKVKELEHQGYQFEGADASFEILVRKELKMYKSFFDLVYFKTSVDEPSESEFSSSAIIKVSVDGKTEITASEGNGPVHALDGALRKALEVFYPQLSSVYLTDYKVRVLDSKNATGAKVRVLIESADDDSSWTTVGVSTDVIDASWHALVDAIEYKLIKDGLK